MSRTRRNRLLAAVAALLALVALAACGDDAADDGTSAATATGPAPAEVTVWFADASGRLVAEPREAPADAEPLAAAMAALAEGPRGAGLLPALPEGTRVLGTGVEGGVAEVDLSAEFERGYPSGGSAAELAIVAPLVRTAAEASGAGRVRILVEGRAPAPVGAQIDLSEPLAPGDVPTGG